MGDLYNSDSDSGSVFSVSSDGVPSPPRWPIATLVKIFMSTPNPNRGERPIIKEWDGKNPGHTKTLFVYACIDNSTYANYVSVGTQKQAHRAQNTDDRGNPYIPDYGKVMQDRMRDGIISCLSSPRACNYPGHPELSTLLPNLMCGIISVDKDRGEAEAEASLVHMNRIYMFDMPTTPGLIYKGHYSVTPPEFTYWYRLNDGYSGDKLTDGAPVGSTVSIYDQSELESDTNPRNATNGPIYKIFRNFRPDNPVTFVFGREPYGKGRKILELKGVHKPNRPTNYRPRHDPNRGPGNVPGHSRGLSLSLSRGNRHGGKKHSKRRNKTRRKYRKIKSRRRRVIR